MIITKNGRSTSLRTDEEEIAMLEKEMESLDQDERATLELMLAEMKEGKTDGLLQQFGKTEYKTTPVDMKTFVMDEYYLGHTCDNLYPKHLEDLTELFEGGYHEAIWTGAIGTGKCLKFNTEVYDPDKGRRTIGELGEDWRVVAMDESTGKLSDVPARAFASTDKPCIKLTLAGGQWIITSEDHPIFTARGWVKAVDLSLGDLVATPRIMPPPTTTFKVSDEEVKLVAYFASDGGCTAGIKFTNAAPEILKEFTELSLSLSDVSKYSKQHKHIKPSVKSRNRGKATELQCSGIRHFVYKYLLNCKAIVKRVPKEFYCLSNRQIALFLNRFWACDGSVASREQRVLECTLASEGLIDDLRFMLLRLGIPARKGFSPKKCNGKLFDAWRLTVSGAPNVVAFFEAIGPIFSKEKISSEALESARAVKPNTNVDVVPIGRPQLLEIKEELGPVRGFRLTKDFECPKDQLLGRPRFRKLVEDRQYNGKYAWLANTDILWERVKSVESTVPCELVDLSVPGKHNFVANNIIVHNTFAASIGVCRVIYELSCMNDPHRSYGLAANSNMSIVVLSVTEALAIKVAFENIATKIEASPYFREYFPFEKTKKELRFPRALWVAARATTDGSALGLNLISSLQDETNFLPKAKGNSDPRLQGLDRAQVIYNMVKRRMKSRFQKRGQLPGKLFLVSSKATDDDFTAKRVRESKIDPSVFVRDYCLTGDTRIPLLSGEILTLKELTNRYEGSDERFEVYSYDVKTGLIAPGKAHHPRLTTKNEKVIIITLDNGESVRATPWHPFLLRNGVYCRADELEIGDSLTPLYRRLDDDGYEEIGQPGWNGRWQKTHHMVARAKYGTWPRRGSDGLPTVIHHENHVKRDNRTDNLEWMEWSAHQKHHQIYADLLTQYVKTPKHRAYASAHMSELHKNPLFAAARDKRGAEHFNNLWKDPEKRKELSAAASIRLSEFHRTERGRIRQSERSLKYWENRRKILVSEIEEGARAGLSITKLAEDHSCTAAAISQALKRSGRPTYSAIKRSFGHSSPNHKIVSIEDGGVEDVYDISVEEFENFGLDVGIFVHNSLWEIKPEEYYSQKKFWVLSGNEQTPSRIVPTPEALILKEALPEGCVLIDVPEDFRLDFEQDIEKSLQDIAGLSTLSVSPFIQRREKIVDAIDKSRKHPFTVEAYDASRGGMFRWDLMVSVQKTRLYGPRGQKTEKTLPIINPTAARHVHIDPALRNDSLGFCMSHISGWRDVQRRDKDDPSRVFMERAPLYVVDFMLRVVPPTGDEIILGDIRRMIYDLTAHGYMITRVTQDSFQSADSIQQLAQRGYTAELLSVDTSPDPYDNLKLALYENRVSYYEYQPLLEELRLLEQKWTAQKKRKIDHPPRKRKDVSDALAGSLWSLAERSTIAIPTPPLKGISKYSNDEAWMAEQQQAAAAGQRDAGLNKELTEYNSMLPPILFGTGSGDPWDPDKGGNGGNDPGWGGGWFPGSL